MKSLPVAAALCLMACSAWAQGDYKDGATSDWFKSLGSAYTQNCCDQADCKLAVSDYRVDPATNEGAWWALSNRTNTWVKIRPDQITMTVSIFPKAVLCEGDPIGVYDNTAQPTGAELPRVFCFAPAPTGF